MKKTFTIDNTEYSVTTCTAIPACELDNGSIEEALLVENAADSGETFQFVVFGYEMPETVEDFEDMCEDSCAWESDSEVLATVEGR